MTRASRNLSAIFAEVRSGLSPDRSYSFVDLLSLCRRRDPHFGYSTLHDILHTAERAGEILHLRRNSYAVPDGQGGVATSLIDIPHESADPTRLLLIEQGISVVQQQQALMDQKIDHLLVLLRGLQGGGQL